MCEKVEIRYEWTCPHCGHRNSGFATVRDRHGSLSPALTYCDIEDGGCDRMVAVRPRLLVQTEVFALVSADDTRRDVGKDTDEEAEARTDYA